MKDSVSFAGPTIQQDKASDIFDLFDWSYLNSCINFHEMKTGKRPEEICLPAPSDLRIFGVKVTFHEGKHTITVGVDTVIHHMHNKSGRPGV